MVFRRLRDTDENRSGSGPGGALRRSARLLILASILALASIPILFYYPVAASDSARAIKKLPFSPGEKLIYAGKWGPIPAGQVTLEVLPQKTLGGNEVYHFAMITETSRAVDLIYKVRERQDSFVDSQLTRSLHYSKRTESKHPRDIVVNFYWDKLEATYTNFGQTSPPIRIPPGTFDPLALIYIVRLRDLKEGALIEVPATDGHMNFAVKVSILKRDSVEILGKVYPAFEATLDMTELDKLVPESEEPYLRIWYSADDRKIPLRIQSKVGILSFSFELVSMAP
jgi:hypothetical protein